MVQQKSDGSPLTDAVEQFAATDIPLEDIESFIYKTAEECWYNYRNVDLYTPMKFKQVISEVMHKMARNLVIQNQRGSIVATDTLDTLRNVVDGYVRKNAELTAQNRALEAQVLELKNRPQPLLREPLTDDIKFTVLQQFEGDQAALVRVVETAQEEARNAKNAANGMRGNFEWVKTKNQEIADELAIYKKANVQLLRENSEMKDEMKRMEMDRDAARRALEQQNRQPAQTQPVWNGYTGPREI